MDFDQVAVNGVNSNYNIVPEKYQKKKMQADSRDVMIYAEEINVIVKWNNIDGEEHAYEIFSFIGFAYRIEVNEP